MRSRINRTRSVTIAITIALASGLGAQQTEVSFDTSRPPRGVVRDPSGQPIRGADVSFRVGRGMRDSMFWRDSILRTRPLPKVRTSRDGEFFMPLTHVHRLFTPRNSGRIHLVVEKDGYHPWIEPLSAGLRGYLGSNVVLQPIRESERLRIEVKRPEPGMLVRVHQFGGGWEYDRWFPVPESGIVATAVSFVPSPLAIDSSGYFAVPIGIEVQLVFPGRTTPGKPLRYRQKKMVIGDKVPNTRFVCVLRVEGDQKPESPRGLYRCPDGRSRWFPVDAENVVESGLLPLLAVDAKRRLAANIRYLDPEKETVALARVPNEVSRDLELRDDGGKFVKEAHVYFFDLRDLPTHREGNLIGAARARRKLMVDEGRLDLGGRALPGPGFLYIEAPGFVPHIHFEPRAVVGTQRVVLGARRKYGSVQLTVTDEDSRPLSGVHIVLNGSSAKLGAHHDGLPRTDERGQVTIECLRSGNHSIRLIGPGLTESTTMLRMRGRTDTKLAVQLFHASRYRMLIVDDDGKPVPFRSVRSYATFLNNNRVRVRSQINTNTTVMSDSVGRILFADLPNGVAPRIMDQLTAMVRRVNNQILDASVIHKMEVGRLDKVLMPLPDAPVVRECLVAGGRTNNRTLVAKSGCGAMIVRFPHGLGSPTLSIYLQGSPPMRLTDEIVAAARKEQGRGILIVDQRKVVRRVRLGFQELGAGNAEDLRIELPGMNFARNRPYVYGNSGLRLQRAGEHWEVGLRDGASVTAKVMHPQFLLTDVEIPALGKGGDKPIEVNLQPGIEVVFRLKSTIKLQPSWQFNIYVHTQGNQVVLYQREKLSESNLRPAGLHTWELRLPFALRPGKYYFNVRVFGTQLNLARRLFTVPETGPLIIEINKRRARVPQQRAAANLAAVTARVQRLKSSAKALRNMGKTDPKSRARLQKVLKGIEEQLETQQKALDELLKTEKAKKKQQLRQAPAQGKGADVLPVKSAVRKAGKNPKRG